MDLQQTIEELERQARQYRQAADQLRALTTDGTSEPGAAASQPTAVQKTTGDNTFATGSSARKAGKASKVRKTKHVSDETRAKISEKLRAAHAAKKAAAASTATAPATSSESSPAPA